MIRSLLHFILEVITLHKHYGYYARILHCCTDQTMTAALAQMDLTAAQGHIMGYLARSSQPPCSRDIEEAFHLSHPTVSGLLARLEKKRFIEFRPDPDDRRCKRIYILPKGHECNEMMHNTIHRIEEQMVQGFSDGEKELFLQFLERSISNMGVCPNQPSKEEPNA